MSKINERLENIVLILKKNNAATIRELSESLHVSEMTIRRDLKSLAHDDFIRLIHGGAVYNRGKDNQNDKESRYYLLAEEARNDEEKIRIADEAVKMINPGDIIMLDTGSTTEYLAKILPENIPLTVMCHSMNVLLEVLKKKNCDIVFPGGFFHEKTLVFESPEGTDLIRRSRANVAFFAAGGIHEELGVTCHTTFVVETKKAMLSSSQKKVLIADSSKFGEVKSSYYADLANFDAIITDSGISEKYRKIVEDSDIELIIV